MTILYEGQPVLKIFTLKGEDVPQSARAVGVKRITFYPSLDDDPRLDSVCTVWKGKVTRRSWGGEIPKHPGLTELNITWENTRIKRR